MCAKVTSIGLKGMEGYRLNVEVKTFVGNDSIRIVGLPDTAVKESKERIIAALGPWIIPQAVKKSSLISHPRNRRRVVRCTISPWQLVS